MSKAEQLLAFTVGDTRQMEEGTAVLCDLQLVPDDFRPEDYEGRLALCVDQRSADLIMYYLELHLGTDLYSPHTTRVLSMILSTEFAGTVVRITGGELCPVEVLESRLLMVEVAGPEADPRKRTEFDNEILMYQPPEEAN